MQKKVKKFLQGLSLALLVSLIFACSKKNEVKKGVDSTINIDVIDDVDNGKTDEVLNKYENAERVGDFLFKEKDEAGNEKSIVVMADRGFEIKTINYDALDLEATYDDVAALKINFDERNVPEGSEDLISEDNENVIIKSGGIYLLKGTLKNKRIKIVKGIGERTQLVLDGFKAETDKENVIYSTEECLTQIFLADGSVNEITLHRDPKERTTDNKESVIFAKEPIVFSGTGKLILNSDFESSVQGDEKVTFVSGNYVFNTKGDAVRVKSDVVFRDGTFDITTGDDAIKATSKKTGCIYIENAKIKVKSRDKGISSDNEVLIAGGEIDIDSNGESIGGKVVNVVGGKINIVSGDDGINASDGSQDKKSNQTDAYIRMMGGEVNIDSKKDGMDSNGDLYLEGGKIFISAAPDDNERIIDYNGKATCEIGLEMIGIGPAEKMQNLGDKPNQSYIIVYYKDAQDPTREIELKDSKDNIILSYAPKNSYKAAIISSANLEAGELYKVVNGTKEIQVSLQAGKNEVWEE